MRDCEHVIGAYRECNGFRRFGRHVGSREAWAEERTERFDGPSVLELMRESDIGESSHITFLLCCQN